MKNGFVKYLKENEFSKNTINSYEYAVKLFESKYLIWSKNNVLLFKNYLIEHYKPKTVNLRLQAINNYLEYIGKSKYKVSQVKIQQKTFLENVISNADYEFLKKMLYQDKKYKWYFIIRFLAATGARISEILKLKYEHIETGFFDIYTKSGKIRRIYIPKTLKNDYLNYCKIINKNTNYVFTNKNNKVFTSRGIALGLKKIAKRYGIDEKVVYPHSFRHLFAKNFINKYNDISLLADLMGHDSIETTRIYLRKTMSEQKNIVDKYINW